MYMYKYMYMYRYRHYYRFLLLGIQAWIQAFGQIFVAHSVNWAAFLIALCSIMLMVAIELINSQLISRIKCCCCLFSRRHRKCYGSKTFRWPFMIPGPLIVVLSLPPPLPKLPPSLPLSLPPSHCVHLHCTWNMLGHDYLTKSKLMVVLSNI